MWCPKTKVQRYKGRISKRVNTFPKLQIKTKQNHWMPRYYRVFQIALRCAKRMGIFYLVLLKTTFCKY